MNIFNCNKRTSLVFVVFLISLAAQAQKDELVDIISAEIDREKIEFKKAAQPPYYIGCQVMEQHNSTISSSFGSLVTDYGTHVRILNTDVRVGDYSFDNTHVDADEARLRMNESRADVVEIPLENDSKAISFLVWQKIQNEYRDALKVYKASKTKEKATDETTDFSKEPAANYIEPRLADLATYYDKATWAKRICRITEPFLNNPDIIDADASLAVRQERRIFVSSEGSRIAQNNASAYLTISGSIRAEDGQLAPLHLSYFSFEPAGLPSEEKIIADVKEMIVKLNQLRTAPVAEPYSGPAILYSRAAGVFFHEIFGHRIEGHRLKDKNDAQTFKSKIGELVLPKNLSVVSDPTRKTFGTQDLNGYYQYDNEGVQARKVTVVDKGILKTFLMSRSPIDNFPNSNGHGRGQIDSRPVARQSNLIIENSKTVPMKELRKMLIGECKKEKKPYGYLFMDVTGGFTTTNRYMPNAFNIFPTEVYRIYTDGRPDQLVRGVDLIGTPLSMFAEIQAADNLTEVFTGYCGAESGFVPVTAVSPSFYVKRIETQKKSSADVGKTILTMPVNGN